MMFKHFALAQILLLGCVVTLQADNLDFFEKNVRPVLAEHCYSCHSVDSKKLKAGLQLDHIDFILKGGDTGPSVVPGKPDESLLIEAVRYANVDLQMPERGKLAQAQIDALVTWVKDGAAWPKEPHPTAADGSKRERFDWKKRRAEHWCWQPIQKAAIPKIAGADHPIDAFHQQALTDKGLTPAPATDRRTWIRRVYFDIIGLPPSPGQVDSFLADTSETAQETVVDELLESPHFGERWGRHWLDLMRYAESCGHEFDYNLNHATEYRDYVIRALNENVPYNRFVQEHVAGDLLPEPRLHPEKGWNESLLGTGFWFLHEAVHAPTDVRKDESDRIDNQIDVFSKSFLGLTVSCARCHDHKFDAIPASDYYAMYGFLQSSRRQVGLLDDGSRIADGAKKVAALKSDLRASANQKDILKYLQAMKVAMVPPKSGANDLLKASKVKDAPRSEIVFEDFESGYDGWKITGKAFGKSPSKGANAAQQPVTGFLGKHLVNSYPGSDKVKGRALSKTFRVERPFINFLCGGGHHKGKTCVNLLVDGKVVLTAEGRGPTDREKLSPRSWNVKPWLGKTARIELVDEESGGWGHINVDHFVFSDKADAPVDKAKKKGPTPAIVAAAAKSQGVDSVVLQRWLDQLNNDALTKNHRHPLHLLKVAFSKSPKPVADQLAALAKRQEADEAAWSKSKPGAHVKTFETSFEGWATTGEAFGEAPVNGAADSGAISHKLQGVIRSPTFVLDGKVNFLIKGTGPGISAKLIIDGYVMHDYSGLLFGGTIDKKLNAPTWQWRSLGNDMYKGHRAHLEFVDLGDGQLAIDAVSFGPRPEADAPNPVSAAFFKAKGSGLEKLAMALTKHPEALITANLLHDPEITSKIAAIEKDLPRPKHVLAMCDGSGEDEHIFIRGSSANLGPVVPRRFPLAIGGEDQATFSEADGSGRLELTKRMFAESNPLPARVMVNRLWHHMFGRGIVPSVNDFGVMGQAPSHPELLDWLAEDFRADWDVKRAIRQIALSQAYGMDSKPTDSHAEQQDARNELLHRMPIRRLQAETIRDGILAVSGRLDRTLLGPSIPANLTAFQQGRGRPASGPLDSKGRRSLYIGVRRNFLDGFMLTFDFPTPSSSKGRRTVSNVPAQALVLMNHPLVMEQSRFWADRLMKDKKTAVDRLEQAFMEIYSRPPTAKEREPALAFLEDQTGGANERDQLADLLHILFNKKEFIYLR